MRSIKSQEDRATLSRGVLAILLFWLAPLAAQPAFAQSNGNGNGGGNPSGGGQSICGTCEPNPLPTQDASFVSQSVPATMVARQSYPVTIQLSNTGSNTWSASNNYKLGSQNPQDNSTWGLSRVSLPGSIATGQAASFSFSVTAPGTPGSYNFQWRMLQEGVAWFGASSTNVSIVVTAPNTPPTVQLTSPSSGGSSVAPASLTLGASAADAGGSVVSVSFWSNGSLLGTDTTAPYSWPLSSISAGSYQFKAVATDNGGASTNSAMVNYTVSASTAAVSATRTYVYDAYERLCKTINPESGATLVDYDAAGNIIWVAEGTSLTSPVCDRSSVADSQKVKRQYDSLNRLKAVTTPGQTADLSETYFADGQVKSLTVSNPGKNTVTTSYDYNKRRLLKSESSSNASTLFSLGYAYDANGNLSQLTYPDNHVVSYAPDPFGRATLVSGSGGVVYASNIIYGVNGAIQGFNYGNGISHAMESNLRLLPTRSIDSYVDGTNTVKVIDDTYTFDGNGNVTDILDRAQNGLTTRGMAYDGLDRLTVAVSPQQWGNALFGYDALDNLRVADQGSRLYRYNYDAANRLANIKNPTGTTLITLAYDSHGNTTSKNSQAYAFDSVNRMNQVTGVQTYRYDGQGRRVQTTDADGKTTFCIYSQSGQVLYTSEARRSQNLSYIYLGNTQVATRAVAWGTGLTSIRFQHTDALGSPVVETDQNKSIVKRNSYTPYGETFGATVIDGTGYTGHVMDRATGLTYMQQRYYDPQIGRFISIDPLEVTSSGDGFARFSYVADNPYGFTDPDGRDLKDTIRDFISPTGAALARRGVPGTLGSNSIGALKQIFNTAAAIAGGPTSALQPPPFAIADNELEGAALTEFATGVGLTVFAGVAGRGEALTQAKVPGLKLEGSSGGPGAGKRFSLATQEAAEAEANGQCVFCGVKTERTKGPNQRNTDHSTPKARGGNNTLRNAQNTCRTCNLKKGVMTTKEFLRSRTGEN